MEVLIKSESNISLKAYIENIMIIFFIIIYYFFASPTSWIGQVFSFLRKKISSSGCVLVVLENCN